MVIYRMSIESLYRTSEKVKIPDTNLDVLSKDISNQNKPKRTCINTLNQRLYAEQKKDKFVNTIIVCVIIFFIGLFGVIIT